MGMGLVPHPTADKAAPAPARTSIQEPTRDITSSACSRQGHGLIVISAAKILVNPMVNGVRDEMHGAINESEIGSAQVLGAEPPRDVPVPHAVRRPAWARSRSGLHAVGRIAGG